MKNNKAIFSVLIFHFMVISTPLFPQEIYKIPGHNVTNTTERYILTPKESPMPKINGPSIYGVHPDSELLYRIPVSGIEPLNIRMQWVPLIKKIQAAGKSVVVDLQVYELGSFMTEVDPKGIYLCINAQP